MTALTKFFGSVIMLSALSYVAYFAVMNQTVVTIYIWPQAQGISLPLWLLALAAFLIGLTLLAIIANLRISALRLRLYQTQKKLDKANHQAEQQTLLATKSPENAMAHTPPHSLTDKT